MSSGGRCTGAPRPSATAASFNASMGCSTWRDSTQARNTASASEAASPSAKACSSAYRPSFTAATALPTATVHPEPGSRV